MHQNADWLGEGDEEKILKARCLSVADSTENFNAGLEGKAYFFVSVLTVTAVTVGEMMKEKIRLDKNMIAFREKTVCRCKKLLRKKSRWRFFTACFGAPGGTTPL